MRHLCILPNAGVPICYQAEVAALQQELSDLRAQYQSLEQVHTANVDALEIKEGALANVAPWTAL